MDASELTLHDRVIFVDENGSAINHKSHEREEQLDAYTFLPRDSTVLELGARYGTVSSIINRLLTDPEKHVVVEPDRAVERALRQNRAVCGNRYRIFIGAVSKTPLSFIPGNYGSVTVQSQGGNVATATIEDLEKEHNLKFDALVADCEGCIESIIRENDLSGFRTILLEQDNVCQCDYEKVSNELSKLGFVRVSHKLNIVYRSVYYNTSSLPFTVIQSQSEFGLGLFGKLGYLSKLDEDHCSDVVIDEKGLFTISAHAPSTVRINVKRPLALRGYCSPTSKDTPSMIFLCDGKVVGRLSAAKEKTEEHFLTEGEHLLQIISEPYWAHSIWLLK